MALQTSGQISLNDIHIEAGGTSGTQAGINDADIRALIGKASGVQMAFSEWYGASASLWDFDLTVGNYNFKGANFWGYSLSTSFGSVTDTSCDFKSGALLEELYFYDVAGSLYFWLEGNHTNAGFTTLTIGSSSFNRTAASFTYDSGANASQWTWGSVSNPFGTTVGVVKDVVFT